MYFTITIKYPIQEKCLCRNNSKTFAGPTTNSIVDKPDLLWNCRLCAENCVQRRPESSLQGWVSDDVGGGGGGGDGGGGCGDDGGGGGGDGDDDDDGVGYVVAWSGRLVNQPSLYWLG